MFNLKLAFLDFIRHKSLMAIQTICLFLGIFVTFFFTAQANGAYHDASDNIKYLKMDQIFKLKHNIYSFDDEFSLSAIYDTIQYFSEVKGAQYFIRIYPDQVMTDKEYVVGTGIYMSSEIEDSIFYKEYMKEGTWKLENNACVVGRNTAVKYRLNVGNIIYINDTEYTIEGITNVPMFSQRIIIPYQEDIPTTSDIEIYLVTIVGKLINQKELSYYVNNHLGSYEIYNSNDLRADAYNDLKRGWAFTIILCLLIMIYSFFALYNVVSFFMKKNKKKIAVMLACGARKKTIFIQKVMELLFINVICIALVAFNLKRVEVIAIRSGIYIYMGWNIIAFNFIITSIMLLALAGISFRSLYKKSISEIFGEAHKS
jgi:ABC-type lipoprotein release transport system permease subunit